eukprot:COSAG02_NODE_5270_length_4483_cov_1.764142_2_plen_427_part_00
MSIGRRPSMNATKLGWLWFLYIKNAIAANIAAARAATTITANGELSLGRAGIHSETALIPLSCEPLSSSTLQVSWQCVDATDLYYVAIFATTSQAEGPTPKPAAIVTTSACSTVLEDLLPSTTYHLRMRSHPSAAPSVVWGWRNYSSPVQRCATKTAPTYTVERHGALASDKIGFRWHANSGNAAAFGEVTALWRRTSSNEVASVLKRPTDTVELELWNALPLPDVDTRTSGIATVAGLLSGSSYAVMLREPNGIVLSDPVRFRTAAVGSSYDTVYRVAEATHEIDLLINHNAGDLKGEAAFLSDSGNYKLTPEQIAKDPCAQALNRTHCRSGSSSCMECTGSVWGNGTGAVADDVRKQCSNPALPFPTDNKAAENWCGDGFSFFDWSLTPVTEYWYDSHFSVRFAFECWWPFSHRCARTHAVLND